MKAKFAGICPVCNEYYEAGDPIAKLDKPIRVHGWVDAGRNSGKKYSKLVSWAHENCVKENGNG